MNTSLRGVTRRDRCKICNRGDWCGVADDGSFAICMRVSSDHPTKNGGWLHRLKRSVDKPQRVRGFRYRILPDHKPQRDDLPELARQWQGQVDPDRLADLSRELGVSGASLQRLCIGWTYDSGRPMFDAGDVMRGAGAWSFPMTDASGTVIGIRLRQPTGAKTAVSGGREGLFTPVDLPQRGELLITEGPTDCAAGLDLGFAAVGRPSCTGGVKLLLELVKVRGTGDVVIAADGDEPGQRGADALASVLVLFIRHLRVIKPPESIKDMRAWKQSGATSKDVRAAIDVVPVRTLSIKHERQSNHA